MRVLISGGFGFVGGRLAQHFHKVGHQVILGSRTVRAPPTWLSEAEVVEMNWYDTEALTSVCQGVDLIIHAAGMNAQDCIANPVEALAFNGGGTTRFIDAASKAEVKYFIYLSTAHVYDAILQGTINEETCTRNLHPYATSHLAGESAVLYASQRKQIKGIVLRMSNAFGPPAHSEANCWMLLVNDLCRQVVETGQIVLKTSGEQLRDFIPMECICEIFQKLIANEDAWKINSAINLGSGYVVSVRSMAELIQQRCIHVMGYEPQISQPDLAETALAGYLEFCTSKLAEIVPPQSINVESEIDRLLSFCSRTFMHKKCQ
jgi:UDP-glucose 4-epimerase